ncbi:MAG: FAD-dependent 5-carboxymethylaminomethyl-2-thiouridine(34) oxidoreductase MnmC [Granulosicoccus sp.]
MPDALPWDQFTNHNPVASGSDEPVIVIGAGLAGCWMARTLAESGIRVTVLEAGKLPASGASSNPAGIVKPFVTRSPGLAMAFYIQAHQYILQQLLAWNLIDACQFTACGVVQLVQNPYPVSTHYRRLQPDRMEAILGVSCNAHGLLFEQSGWLNPSALCHELLQHPSVDVHCSTPVEAIERLDGPRWKIKGSGKISRIASHVVLCTGAAIAQLPLSRHLPITPARGQITRFAGTNQTATMKRVISGKHYFIPDAGTVIVGATFERGVSDASLKSSDNQSNLAGIRDMLPALHIDADAIQAYAGIRATTPDRLPIVGPLPDTLACGEAYADLYHGRKFSSYPDLPCHSGAYVLGGLGSRGIVTAPYAARLLTDHLRGGHQLSQWAPLTNPARFQIRNLKRTNIDQI